MPYSSYLNSMVLGQNGSGQNGTDKMVCEQDGIGQNKGVWTNGTDKMVRIQMVRIQHQSIRLPLTI